MVKNMCWTVPAPTDNLPQGLFGDNYKVMNVSIDGNIGSGKGEVIEYIKNTKMLKNLARVPWGRVVFQPQPVGEWNKRKPGLLKRFEANPPDFARELEELIISTSAFNCSLEGVYISERSLASTIAVLLPTLLQNGYLMAEEASYLLTRCRRQYCYTPDICIWIDTDAEKCHRKLEFNQTDPLPRLYTLEYLKDIEWAHKQWFNSDARVIRVVGDRSIQEVAADVAQLIEYTCRRKDQPLNTDFRKY
jgi:hypothetical protein